MKRKENKQIDFIRVILLYHFCILAIDVLLRCSSIQEHRTDLAELAVRDEYSQMNTGN